MKIILSLIITLLLTNAQAAQQVVLGSYTQLIGAQEERAVTQALVESDQQLYQYLLDHNVSIMLKEFGEYYIITLEPFLEHKELQTIYPDIRRSFPDAYILTLQKQKSKAALALEKTKKLQKTQEQEIVTPKPQIIKTQETQVTHKEPVIQKETQEPVVQEPITKEEDAYQEPSKDLPIQQNLTQEEEFNVFEKYLLELILGFALIGLALAYVAIIMAHKKKKKGDIGFEEEDLQEPQESEIKQEEHQEPLKEEPAEPLEEQSTQEQESKQEEPVVTTQETPVEPAKSSNELQQDHLAGQEEGSFEVESSTPAKQKASEKNPRAKKREVPVHGKIAKTDFEDFAGLRILVAEDNLINQKVIKGLLADTGIELVMANDGKEALDILAQDKNFKFILMDAHMPRIDGFEATRKIRANPDYAHILVVALSGDTAADDIRKMQEAGMEEHLEKPLRMDALYDVLYAYTDPDEDNSSDDAEEYVEVVMTQELNGDKGLEICGGDEAFYHEILDEFVRNYSDSAKKLHEYLHVQEMAKADKLLLDITGITANIGADTLNKFAHDLKEALQDTEEKSYLTLADQYEKHLHALLKDIRTFKV